MEVLTGHIHDLESEVVALQHELRESENEKKELLQKLSGCGTLFTKSQAKNVEMHAQINAT